MKLTLLMKNEEFLCFHFSLHRYLCFLDTLMLLQVPHPQVRNVYIAVRTQIHSPQYWWRVSGRIYNCRLPMDHLESVRKEQIRISIHTNEWLKLYLNSSKEFTITPEYTLRFINWIFYNLIKHNLQKLELHSRLLYL